jgi:hypothetical protein
MLSLSAGIWFLPLDNPEGTTLNQQLTLPTTPHKGGGIISESGGDYFSDRGGGIISE